MFFPFFLFFLYPFIVYSQGDIKFNENTFGDITVRQIGPATMSGRISAIDAVDKNPALVYVGAASGGLWKSKNWGTTFKPVFDKYNQAIGCIAIDQDRPDTVWVGTGEVWVRNSTSVGDGIYKTTNGGETWKKMGLEKSERIAKIVIHPKNPDILYVAVLGNLWNSSPDRGLYKTSDGGKTWEKVLYVDENTGCSDVAIDRQNPDILYAGMWEFRRTPWSFSSGGKGSGLFRSADGGKTWSKVTKELPEGILGRVAISVSPVKSEIVYALIEAKPTTLFRSGDKGLTWNRVTESQAVSLVHQNHPIRSDEGRAHRTHLGAGRILAVVAQLGNEEILTGRFGRGRESLIPTYALGNRREPFLAAIRRDDFGVGEVPVGHMVAFHPGAEVSIRHIVLRRTGAYAVAASDALRNVDQHAPPVIGHGVVGRFFGRSRKHILPRDRRRGQHHE